MDSFYVQGGIALQGKVKIQGSKNAALPILAACLLVEDQICLENCPKISDVEGMLRIMKSLGCQVRWEKNALLIQASGVQTGKMPEDAVTSMRSSVFLLGAMIARCRVAELEAPGGCVIGKRPIDLHVRALEKMGVQFEDCEGSLKAWVPEGLHGCDVYLDFPSVGATENVILAATAAEGETRIRGAAKEPEVQALCEFLIACGARILGVGKAELCITGGIPLRGCAYRIPSDRIVAGTYLLSGFCTGGEIFLEDAPVRHMNACMDLAEKMGAALTVTGEGVYCQFPKRAGCLPLVRTDVYPGFPTDLQSVLLAVRCTGEGETVVQENIFENRFRIRDALVSMGAKIQILDEHNVKITGVPALHGADIEACELRGGAALVAAALGAKGNTRLRGRRFVERGYENIGRDYRELGARIISG